ncbi:Aliphatic sulfonates import ATP-binding protein SsuB [Paenibacillus sp. CECT 9249]|uniref:ABC transporter ATP-binding protein n=1 Tax=Paenibacillus sp. CECT 9249 TaxID=2845385 RepID=UPI001E54C573|nr:ABC transporter ATP-binding protein [Paenibacillus sp. CECT 9249]CAH0118432.1 Aliphatic sulfonates import ATP-binding protein SsuB [Paenibacillus sp. CECT 9249]
MAAPKLEVDRIGKSFLRDGRQHRVLDDITLSVGQGEFVSLVGPSGSGKSTLLQLIGGLLLPDSGGIRIDGETVTGRKGLISYMPQQPALFPWFTIEENVTMALDIAGGAKRSRQALREQAHEWLARAGLGGYERQYPRVLSGGMQQRASFVRAMLSPQELICLDEPFGALDALTRLHMQQWLLGLWERHRRSVLLVTHSIDEAIYLSDRIYVLSSSPARVVRQFAVPFPRPRDEKMLHSEAFLQLKQDIYGLLKRNEDAYE